MEKHEAYLRKRAMRRAQAEAEARQAAGRAAPEVTLPPIYDPADEAAEVIAPRAAEASPDFDGRLDHITLRLMDRKLRDDEKQVIRASFDEVLDNFRKDPDDAGKLLATGDSPAPKGGDLPELAAWTVVSSQILNLDETITR